MQIESYSLDLDVDFPRAIAAGTVDIAVTGAEGSLLLNAERLEVKGVKVNGVRVSYKAANGTLRIPRVTKARSVVTVRFVKQVSEETVMGLYKSKYGKSYLLATDFEPARARTFFPCKDEPSYKAVFNLAVTTQTGLSVISNTPVASKEDSAGKTKFVFEPTPRMSTYLFFLGVGPYEERKRKSDGIDIIVASRPGLSENSEFALGVASDVLRGYGEYFGIKYPLKKLHLIALPEYRAGAMENWGAITYRERLVLADSSSSTSDLRAVAHVTAHEIAHQWFGDLVTMKWWDDIWLNESFASLMDNKMLEQLHPEWENWRDFLRSNTFPALNSDALAGTHPIQAKVRSVDEIESIFDNISYGKGASVLRMIESYIGEDRFREGVSAYLKKFSYANAEGEDLWRSLQKASGRPVSRLARAWITKPGFPLVRAAVSGGGVKFTQERFSYRGRRAKGTWPVPLTMINDGKKQTLLLERRTGSIRSKSPSEVLLNPGRTGFYSVLYDPEMYDRIAKDFSAIHSHDRAGILSDLYLFVKAGMVEPALYFRFVGRCGELADALTTQAVADQLVDLRAIADEAKIVRGGYGGFYEGQLKVLGLQPRKGEDESVGEVREAITIMLARTSTRFAAELAPRFEEYESVEPNLKSAVAISYAISAGAKGFEALLELAKGETKETERVRILRALASSPDGALVEKALDLSLSGRISRSDVAYAVSFASANPRARSALWKWLQGHYDALRDAFGMGFLLGGLDAAIPRCGVESEQEVRRFLSGERYREGEMTFRRTLERLEANSNLRRRLLALES